MKLPKKSIAIGRKFRKKISTKSLIYSINTANEKDKKWLINSVKRYNNDKKRVREIIQYVKDNGGIEYTQKMMKKYSQEALDILYEFPENEYRNSLETMVKYVMEREK